MTDTTSVPGIQITTSKQWMLNYRDFLKGLLVAVIGAVLTTVQTSLDAGSLTFNWKTIATVGITAGVAYLVKNFATPSQIILKKDNAQPVTIATTTETVGTIINK